jgi:hypothetical protein
LGHQLAEVMEPTLPYRLNRARLLAALFTVNVCRHTQSVTAGEDYTGFIGPP